MVILWGWLLLVEKFLLQEELKSITIMRSSAEHFHKIIGGVQFCCWSRTYQPMGCFHWPSFLLRPVLHFSPAECAFLLGDSLSFPPCGRYFPCTPLAWQSVNPPRSPLPHLCSNPQCLYAVCGFIQYVSSHRGLLNSCLFNTLNILVLFVCLLFFCL